MKTYCISDIHGHYRNLLAFKNSLEADDKVFVLGDAIDKGEDPIACLKLIMDDDRFEMLLGNHEYMMWQFLSAPKDSPEMQEAYIQWVVWNKGGDTLDPYMLLEEDERQRIYEYIEGLPLNIPDLEIGGRRFYLVHSLPGSDEQVTMKDLNYSDPMIFDYVWERRYIDEELRPYEDRTVIAGHTAVQEYTGKECAPYFRGDDIMKAPYIDIDGGLAYHLRGSRLIALCLDDMTYELY